MATSPYETQAIYNLQRYLRQLSTDEKMRTVIAKVFADLFRTALELRKRKDTPELPE